MDFRLFKSFVDLGKSPMIDRADRETANLCSNLMRLSDPCYPSKGSVTGLMLVIRLCQTNAMKFGMSTSN
jgi:hypothetical protein